MIYGTRLQGPVTFLISCIDPAFTFKCKTQIYKSLSASLFLAQPDLWLGCRTQHEPTTVTSSSSQEMTPGRPLLLPMRAHHQPDKDTIAKAAVEVFVKSRC